MRIAQITLCLLLLGPLIPQCGRADEKDLVRAATKILVEQSSRQDVPSKEVARKWTRSLIAILDPKKMHFLASDEKDLLNFAVGAFDEAQQGKFDFAIDTVELFRKRLLVNSKVIRQHLASPHDFNLDESMTLSYEEYPVSENDSNERWRKRIKYELLVETQAGMEFEEARKFLFARYETIQKHYDSLNSSDILAIYIDALAKSLDPNSRYLDSKTLASFRTGIIPPVTLGIETAYQDGDLWIKTVENNAGKTRRRLIGKRIVAVSAEGKDTVHITGLTPDAAYYTLYSPIGDLGFTNRIKVELDDPQNGDRFSIQLHRFPGSN